MRLYVAVIFSTDIVFILFLVLCLVANMRALMGKSISKTEMVAIQKAQKAFIKGDSVGARLRKKSRFWFNLCIWLGTLIFVSILSWFLFPDIFGTSVDNALLLAIVAVIGTIIVTAAFIRGWKLGSQVAGYMAAAHALTPAKTHIPLYLSWSYFIGLLLLYEVVFGLCWLVYLNI